MTEQVFVNGRFLTQPVTGVQRFALETTAAIERMAAAGQWPETTILTPRAKNAGGSGHADQALYRLPTRVVGRMQGQIWEQLELACAARSGTLISLANTGPVLAGAKQIVVIHDAGVFDTPESYSPQFRLWYRIMQRRLISAGAVVVTVSAFSQRRISERLGLTPQAIPVIYEGSDHILRAPSEHHVLRRHNLRSGRFALVVGAGAAHKNLEAMQQAARLLARRGLVLAIAGGLGLASVYSSSHATHQFGQPLGRVTDGELRALYENALCLLFPSRYEGFGLPPVEAMACGCPVIASRGGAVEEICRDSVLYFSSHEGLSLAEAIEQLLDEPALPANLRSRGLVRAAELTWNRSARLLRDVLQRMH